MSRTERRPTQPQRPQTPKDAQDSDVWEFGGVGATRDPKDRVAAHLWELEGVVGSGDREIARVAERQRGLVHRRQAIAAGIGPDAIKHRLRMRRLHALYRDVYLVGRPRLEPLAAATAAIMHFDGHAVLSHASAGTLWDLIDARDAPDAAVEVTVVGIDARPRRALRVHRATTLERVDVRLHSGLPITAPARTIVDLAGRLDEHELEAALARCLRRRLATRAEVNAALERASRAAGRARLRRILDATNAPTLTRSAYERKLLDLIIRAELPRPQVNAKVDGMEVDLLWPDRRLIVEFDGFAFHSGRASFERDRLRDQRLAAAGYRVLRITARQLDRTPESVIARIAAALAL